MSSNAVTTNWSEDIEACDPCPEYCINCIVYEFDLCIDNIWITALFSNVKC